MCWDQMASVLVVCSSEHLLACRTKELSRWAGFTQIRAFFFRPDRASLTSRRAEITDPQPKYGFGFCPADGVSRPPITGRKTIRHLAAPDHWRDLRLVTWRYQPEASFNRGTAAWEVGRQRLLAQQLASGPRRAGILLIESYGDHTVSSSRASEKTSSLWLSSGERSPRPSSPRRG